MQFTPYLNFDGTCREAFTWYQEIFGGDLTVLGPEVGGGDVPPEFADRVIHAALVMPNGALLMASDTQPGGHHTPKGLYVNVAVDTVDEAQKVWAELSKDAAIEMDLEPSFFSPMFGVLTDRFGTPWMLSTASEDTFAG